MAASGSRKSSTRLIRTKPYHLSGVILRNSDYVNFNESTIKNAQKVLKTVKKKPVGKKKLAAIPEIPDERETIRLMEEFEKADEFELCVEYHRPERYVLDGKKITESPNYSSPALLNVKRQPKNLRDISSSILEETLLRTDQPPTVIQDTPAPEVDNITLREEHSMIGTGIAQESYGRKSTKQSTLIDRTALPKSIDESDGLMNSQQDEHMEDRTQRIDTSSKIPDSSKDRSSSLPNVKRPSSLRNLSESVQAEGTFNDRTALPINQSMAEEDLLMESPITKRPSILRNLSSSMQVERLPSTFNDRTALPINQSMAEEDVLMESPFINRPSILRNISRSVQFESLPSTSNDRTALQSSIDESVVLLDSPNVGQQDERMDDISQRIDASSKIAEFPTDRSSTLKGKRQTSLRIPSNFVQFESLTRNDSRSQAIQDNLTLRTKSSIMETGIEQESYERKSASKSTFNDKTESPIDESDVLMDGLMDNPSASQQDERMEDRTQCSDNSFKLAESPKDQSSSLLNLKRQPSLRNLSKSVQVETLPINENAVSQAIQDTQLTTAQEIDNLTLRTKSSIMETGIEQESYERKSASKSTFNDKTESPINKGDVLMGASSVGQQDERMEEDITRRIDTTLPRIDQSSQVIQDTTTLRKESSIMETGIEQESYERKSASKSTTFNVKTALPIDESNALMNSSNVGQQDEVKGDRTQRIDVSSEIAQSPKDRNSSILNIKLSPKISRNLSKSVQVEILDHSSQATQDNHLATAQEIDNLTLRTKSSIMETGIAQESYERSKSASKSTTFNDKTALQVDESDVLMDASSVGQQDESMEEDITRLIDTSSTNPLEQLLAICKQDEIVPFEDLLDHKVCTKIGEGSFGEVFKTKVNGHDVALKIVPFTLEQEIKKINGDFMKSASAIIPEAVISQQLSMLSNDYFRNTNGFANVVKMSVVKGSYPKILIKAWKAYKSKNKDAVNDSPMEYSNEEQLYIAIALEIGGIDLEKFKVKNEEEAVSILIQVIMSLRVAENRLQFEHRDLHIGNVLVQRFGVDETIRFTLTDDNKQRIESHGVVSTIIDFTNSRISKGGMTIYLDLSIDPELFDGPTNEYQFQIYRDMKKVNKNEWSEFTPKTNCLWVHYLSTKLIAIRGIRAKRRKELQEIFDLILGCESLEQFMELEDVGQLFASYFLVEASSSEESEEED